MNNIKILIVEDEAIAALCLMQQLKSLNLNVLPPVGRGEKAVDVSIREKPDVIFMDIVLASNMNGIEAAKEILRTYTPVIIFTTGYQDKNYAEQINSLRAFVFYKPYDINDLLSLIEQKFANVSEV